MRVCLCQEVGGVVFHRYVTLEQIPQRGDIIQTSRTHRIQVEFVVHVVKPDWPQSTKPPAAEIWAGKLILEPKAVVAYQDGLRAEGWTDQERDWMRRLPTNKAGTEPPGHEGPGL